MGRGSSSLSMGSMMILGFLVVGVLMLLEVEKVSGGLSKAECKLERKVGVNACKSVLSGKPPTAQCCRRVRVSHVECICPVITPKLAALIDPKQFIRFVQGCGRRIPRHFKCGSLVAP